MLAKQPNALRRQDTQAITSLAPALDPHAQRRWEDRAPDEFEDWPVQMAWRRADSIGSTGEGFYARYHEPSGMLIYAEWGFISTAIRVDEATGNAPDLVADYKEGMLDGE
jgi:hypothetical protein